VYIEGLEAGRTYPYSVELNGVRVWPEPESKYPPSVIRTLGPDETLNLVFGSCRVTLPHEPPYTLRKDDDERGFEMDALTALVRRMTRSPVEEWPHALLFLGDQIYADEVSKGALEYLRSRRDPNEPPGEQVADFEEYCRLYWDAWSDPAVRWLLSTVPSAMIFDDHDLHDDWNTSEEWVRTMRRQSWWNERVVGGFMSYWIYQHIGNLSPEVLREDELYSQVHDVDDAADLLRTFAEHVDRTTEGKQWSYHRDIGGTRLVMMDSRAGRVLVNSERKMVDDGEWDWIERYAVGDFDHLLLGTSLPVLLGHGMHHLEAWNEAVCAGAWGNHLARHGERMRQGLDLEHWAAFEDSFQRLTGLMRKVARGERGKAPATIVVLSGDVHHAYLARAQFRRGTGAKSRVYQAVCSPFRNPLSANERRVILGGWSRLARILGGRLARGAGVSPLDVDWRIQHERPWFDNQFATLELKGRRALLRIEKTVPTDNAPELETVFEETLA